MIFYYKYIKKWFITMISVFAENFSIYLKNLFDYNKVLSTYQTDTSNIFNTGNPADYLVSCPFQDTDFEEGKQYYIRVKYILET